MTKTKWNDSYAGKPASQLTLFAPPQTAPETEPDIMATVAYGIYVLGAGWLTDQLTTSTDRADAAPFPTAKMARAAKPYRRNAMKAMPLERL